jgi:glycerol-3-phosphate cytidylyltransferase
VELDRKIIMERTEKKIIGYTTGVFDMFHIGHLNILKRAKEQCDYLIVGVSTDEVVEEYKKKTPIIKFEERIAIVEAIKYVDEVVPQTTMDKMEAWKQLKFDVMFHGSDWKGSDMYNHIIEKFNNVGVKVIFLPHTEGVSSTLLTEVLYNKKNSK